MDTAITTEIAEPTLVPVAYKGVPVMTTEKLAEALGGTADNLNDNYRRNAERFTEGDHVFKLVGSALKEVKDNPAFSRLVADRAKHLMLWTERGAFRHAKLLNTPEAWAAYEKLEQTYFAVKAGKYLPAPAAVKAVGPRFRDWLSCAKLIGLKDGQAIIAVRAPGRLAGESWRWPHPASQIGPGLTSANLAGSWGHLAHLWAPQASMVMGTACMASRVSSSSVIISGRVSWLVMVISVRFGGTQPSRSSTSWAAESRTRAGDFGSSRMSLTVSTATGPRSRRRQSTSSRTNARTSGFLSHLYACWWALSSGTPARRAASVPLDVMAYSRAKVLRLS